MDDRTERKRAADLVRCMAVVMATNKGPMDGAEVAFSLRLLAETIEHDIETDEALRRVREQDSNIGRA